MFYEFNAIAHELSTREGLISDTTHTLTVAFPPSYLYAVSAALASRSVRSKMPSPFVCDDATERYYVWSFFRVPRYSRIFYASTPRLGI